MNAASRQPPAHSAAAVASCSVSRPWSVGFPEEVEEDVHHTQAVLLQVPLRPGRGREVLCSCHALLLGHTQLLPAVWLEGWLEEQRQ